MPRGVVLTKEVCGRHMKCVDARPSQGHKRRLHKTDHFIHRNEWASSASVHARLHPCVRPMPNVSLFLFQLIASKAFLFRPCWMLLHSDVTKRVRRSTT